MAVVPTTNSRRFIIRVFPLYLPHFSIKLATLTVLTAQSIDQLTLGTGTFIFFK